MQFYHCGEKITAATIQDEAWYWDYQAVGEVLTAGDDGDFYEELPDGFELAKLACKRYFRRFPGPSDWKPPDDEQLERWIRSMWLSEETIAKLKALRDNEQARKIP